jgi:hypothetical protein
MTEPAEHSDTLTTRGNLASWTGEAGDAAGARDQYAARLPIYARVLGPEHPDTLSTRESIAFWARLAGTARAPWGAIATACFLARRRPVPDC